MAKGSNPIPEDYQELIGDLSQNEFYIAAWNHALTRGNESPKACMVFADAHWQDFEPGQAYGAKVNQTKEDLDEEIARLMAKREQLEQSAS